MDSLPLLVFPQARAITPLNGKGFPSSKPHFPDLTTQVGRLSPQLKTLQQEFSRYQASISGTVSGMEPETVLVIEIAGAVENFKQAVEATEGLEWIGEWDIEDIEPDEHFYNLDNEQFRSDKPLTGRLFISLSNEQGINELLVLWKKWEKKEELPWGKRKWREVFTQTRNIRRWGFQETLIETGMIDRWRELLDPIDPRQSSIFCQIEMFYRSAELKRQANENAVRNLLTEIGGKTISPFIDILEIGFHAVKAELPISQIRRLIEQLNAFSTETDIQLFKFPGIMYFRPTGQGMVISDDAEIEESSQFQKYVPELEPVAAILDGVPNMQHIGLKHHLVFDDPEDLAAEYQPGERKHGTSMASLIIHGELESGETPLMRKVYHRAIIQPNPQARSFHVFEEHFPNEVFFEDRIERAVRRMFEGEGDTPPQATGVKIINLSIGDRERPFIHSPSPWAKLLDWLSWKYRVLFCVSAGNYLDSIDLGFDHNQFARLTEDEKAKHTLLCISHQLSQRRLLSPAESINALTIGALHSDASTIINQGHRVDLLPNPAMFSPMGRLGHGFRRSIKPEILFPGGRQLYQPPVQQNDTYYKPVGDLIPPGQKVAWDSSRQGETSATVHTRGTSNATALTTRSGVRIYEVLAQLQEEHGAQIRDNLIAVLIKTLLVHGACHNQEQEILKIALKTPQNSRRLKEVISRYMGYGAVDIERVLACTEQRGTILGCGEITSDQIHEYRFPLPSGLSRRKDWRRMVVTLGWFTPINPAHRNLREAKLEFQPVKSWEKLPLRLHRADSDRHQVQRGTIQHEVLESDKEVTPYQEDGHILLHVVCKPDATEKLDITIPYGLAVTLEVAEGIEIPIYQQIRARIRQQIKVTG